MKIALLRVDDEPSVFAALFEALEAAGLRWGWLDLASAAPPPAALEAAAGHGALRAVSAVGDRAVAVKPVRGGFVLRDLLREHFRGCRLVLVRGEVEASLLGAGAEGGWVVADERLTTDELVAHLRKPSWPALP